MISTVGASPARRPRLLATTLAAVVVVALAVAPMPSALAGEGGSGSWPPPKPEHDTPFSIERINETDAGASADDETLTASLSGDGLVAAYSSWAGNLAPADRPDAQIYLHSATGVRTVLTVQETVPGDPEMGLEPTTVTRAVDGTDVALDADGSTAAVVSYIHEAVRVIDVASGSYHQHAFVGHASSPALSDDGNTVAYLVNGEAVGSAPEWKLLVARASDDAPTEVASLGAASLPTFALSPDGSRLAYYRWDAGRGWTSWEVDLDDPSLAPRQIGVVDTTGAADRVYAGPAYSRDGMVLGVVAESDDVAGVQLRGPGGAVESLAIFSGEGSDPRLVGGVRDFALDGDGSTIAFSFDDYTVASDTQVWVYDRDVERLALVTATSAGAPAAGSSFDVAIGRDGTRVLFLSGSQDFDPADGEPNFTDVFVGERDDVERSAPPTWPAGAAVTAEQVRADAVDLAWSAATDDIGISVYQVLVDGRIDQEVPAPAGPGTVRATVDGLRGSTSYVIEVRAVDTHRQKTAPLQLTVETAAPTAAWLDAVATGPYSVHLRWPYPAATVTGDGYRVVRTGGGAEQTFEVDGLETTEYVDGSVAPDTTYQYSLLRVVDGRAVPYAGPEEVPTPSPDAALVLKAPERGAVHLSWQPDPAGADGYRILRGSKRFDLEALATVDDVTEFVDATVAMGTSYYYRVETIRGTTTHRYTVEEFVSTRSGAWLTGSQWGGVIDLRWEAAEVDGYVVQRSLDGEEWTDVVDLDGDRSEHRDVGRPAESELRYRVLERRGDGSRVPYSQVFQITTAAIAKPTGRLSTENAAWDVIRVGSDVTIEATGQPGRTARALIEYSSWYEEGSSDPGEAPVERTAAVALEPGDVDGTYQGTFPLPDGAASLDSVVIELSDGSGAAARSDELLASETMAVSGGVHITMTEGDGFVQAGASSVGSWFTYVEAFNGREVVLDQLVPGRSWDIRIYHDQGGEVAKATPTVRPGVVEHVTLDPVLPASLTLTVTWPQGRPDGYFVAELASPGGRRHAAAGPEDIDDGADPGTDTFLFDQQNLREGDRLHPGVRISPRSYHRTIEGPFIAYPQRVTAAEATVLPAGGSELTMSVDPLPQGLVRGRLTEGDGTALAGAIITATQTVDDRPWSYRAIVDAEGRFSMPVLAGEVRVLASLPGDVAPVVLTASDDVGEGAVLDLTRDFAPARDYTIVPTLRSVAADETVGVVQRIEERAIRSRWPVWLDRGGHRTSYRGPDWVVQARPGTTAQMCGADATVSSSKTCVDIAFGDDREVAAEVTVQASSRIVAAVEMPDGTKASRGWAQLFEVRDGVRAIASAASVRDGIIEMSAGPGSYELRVETGAHEGLSAFTITGEKQIDVDVILASIPDWSFTPASGITATPAVAAPGGLIDLRVAVQAADGESDMEDAAVVIRLPGDLAVQGAQIDGVPIATDLPQADEDDELVIPVPGTVGSARERIVRVQVATDPTLVGRVPFEAALRIDDAGSTKDLHLGGTSVEVGVLTLEAPSLTTTQDVWLSGRGPIGAAVDVYVDGRLLGSVGSIPAGGRWRHRVTLPTVRGRGTFELHAVARIGALEQRSGSRQIVVDVREPTMTRVQVYQDGGRFKEFDPTEGVARFPYVFAPHQKTYVRLHFEQADRVHNVRIRVVDTEVVAERQADGWFHAELQTRKFGRISTRYDIAALPLQGLDDVAMPAPEDAERHNAAVFQGAIPTSGPETPGSASFVLPNLSSAECRAKGEAATVADGCVEMTMSVEIDRSAPYLPSEEDAAVEQLSGVQASHPTFDVSATDGTISIGVVGELGEAFLPPIPAGEPADGDAEVAGLDQTTPRLFALQAFAAAARAGGGRARINIDIKGLQEKYESAEEVYEQIKDVVDGFDHLEQMIDRIAYLRRWAAICPSNAITSDIPADLDEIQKHIRVAQIADAGNRVFFAKAPLGAGSAIYSKVGEVMSKSWSVGFGRHLDRAEAMLRAADCDPPPDGGGSSSSGGGSGGSGGGGDDDGGGGGGDTLADPTPIYDPSGYVYEGMHSNRIDGVTATVMQAKSKDGPWSAWDAEWFGQENPLITDPNGRYGWDVPEDWWQVVFTKDGYHRAMSDELRVLPPHFDVNIGITSVQPAAVASATAMAGDPSALLLGFDRPVQVGSVADAAAGHAEVRNKGERVPGTWAPIAAEDDPQRPGGQLAMLFRFTPEGPLAEGDVVQVSVGVGVVDYAGRPLRRASVRDVTVAAAPLEPGDGDDDPVTPPAEGESDPVRPPQRSVRVPAEVGGDPVRVAVATPAGTVRVELTGVRQAGTLRVEARNGAARRGFRLLDTWFEVDLDVAFASAIVCVPFRAAAAGAAGVDPSSLSLLHGLPDASVEDVTVFVGDDEVCGAVTSFSPFYVGAPATERLAGGDRYRTAAAISRMTFSPGVDVAYVVTGATFADGLAGGAAAARVGAPVLLTSAVELPDATREELHRLRPARIEVVGGPAAIRDTVVAQLRGLTDGPVARTAGADRYATAAQLAITTFDRPDTVYVATGRGFADALSGGAAAIGDDAPLLLLPEGDLPGDVVRALETLAPASIVIVGGTDAIGARTAGQLAAVTGATVRRRAGTDRYETAARVAREAGAGRSVIAASGETFADALAGLPLAAERDAALVLVRPESLPGSLRTVLEHIRPPRLTVLGGTAAVGRNVEVQLAGTMAD